MIAVDTSVWISFFRGSDPHLASALGELLRSDRVVLPLPVRIELLGGSGQRDRRRLQPLLASVPALVPDGRTWAGVEAWVEEAATRGQHFGMGDLLIAALAAEGQHSLWSLDADFRRMARLGWVQLHLSE
jgi:predicted nucleic acid-binding protein